jgi:hypothetical protein
MSALRRSLLASAFVASALTARLSAAPTPPPTPTPSSVNPAENPEDIRARQPRPTPLDTETKFPPPQQSKEDEARDSNRPNEGDLLQGERPVLLDGRPFPERRPYDPKFPEGRRTRFVSIEATEAGDGSLEHPWNDLQKALCALEPGDRLVVASGIYTGSFRVAGACRDGTAEAPIQVFARHAFLKSGGGDVLTLERAHWQFWELQIALLDSKVAGLTTRGPGAHDIAIDQTHIYEGNGPAVVIGAGSEKITVSNCHIHQSTGVRIEDGTSQVTLVNNHIHHNRAASVTIGGGSAGAPPAGRIELAGNRIHNDHGPGLVLERCDGVAVRRNRFSNYRPDEDDGSGGEAVVVAGCRSVAFENNSVLEATVAVRVGLGADGKASPEAVSLGRNYLQNTLTEESTGFAVDAGRTIRVSNNVVDHYSEPFRIAPGVRGLTVANNLVLAPRTAFTLGSWDSVALFDSNVFVVPAALTATVSGKPVDAEWFANRMPRSRTVGSAELLGGDLGALRIPGINPVDAGAPLEGASFQGKAPDIGVAEH